MTIGELFLLLKKYRKKAKYKKEKDDDFHTRQNILRENKDFLTKIDMSVENAKAFNIRQKNFFLKP